MIHLPVPYGCGERAPGDTTLAFPCSPADSNCPVCVPSTHDWNAALVMLMGEDPTFPRFKLYRTPEHHVRLRERAQLLAAMRDAVRPYRWSPEANQ